MKSKETKRDPYIDFVLITYFSLTSVPKALQFTRKPFRHLFPM